MMLRVHNDYEWDDYESWEEMTEDEDWNDDFTCSDITQYSLLDWEWNKIIDKLQKGRLRLTTQEENTIAKIANRL